MKTRSPITTHVLDLSQGRAAGGVKVLLESQGARGVWSELASSKTNTDGRVEDLLKPDAKLKTGAYRLSFDIASYFKNQKTFYPSVSITFEVADADEHYHVPLLISPFGYSTYRGT